MLARSLIVLLVVLNLGVAAWWMARDAAAPSAPSAEPPAGVAQLRLLSEVAQARGADSPSVVASSGTTPGPSSLAREVAGDVRQAADPAAPAAAPAEQEPLQCYAIGPFSDA